MSPAWKTGREGGTYAPGSEQPTLEHQGSKFKVLRFDGSLEIDSGLEFGVAIIK